MKCFVIMPIRATGTADHLHFRALYDEWIRPIAIQHGYLDTYRADDIKRAGAITEDIVTNLAEADLVIADLTDLNPNVFYELGVRHVLRGFGTIMLLDVGRTPEVPFDLHQYHVVRFQEDMQGMATLRRELEEYLKDGQSIKGDRRDNPVHNWLPSLPLDAVAASSGSEAGQLRQQLKDLQDELSRYRDKYGLVKGRRDTGEELTDRLRLLTERAKDGSLGPDLYNTAHNAAGRQDKVTFLDVLQRVASERDIRLTPRQYVMLAGDANDLDLQEAAGLVYDLARRIHPNDKELRHAQLAHFTHSLDAGERARARQELLEEIGVREESGQLILPAVLMEEETLLVGLMLDAYHEDDLNTEALRIIEALNEHFPNRSILVRNLGRALNRVGGEGEREYQRAIWCPDRTDTSAVWFGSYLHNHRRTVDALEAYAFACLLDRRDGTNFAQVADELARALEGRGDPLNETAAGVRELPQQLSIDDLYVAIQAAISAELLAQNDIDRCVTAASTAGIPEEFISVALAARQGGGYPFEDKTVMRLRQSERAAFAGELYAALESPLTRPDTPIR